MGNAQGQSKTASDDAFGAVAPQPHTAVMGQDERASGGELTFAPPSGLNSDSSVAARHSSSDGAPGATPDSPFDTTPPAAPAPASAPAPSPADSTAARTAVRPAEPVTATSAPSSASSGASPVPSPTRAKKSLRINLLVANSAPQSAAMTARREGIRLNLAPAKDLGVLDEVEVDEDGIVITEQHRKEFKLARLSEVASEVHIGMLVGGHQVACNKELLQGLGVTTVINVAADVVPTPFIEEEWVTYLGCFMYDSPKQDISGWFPLAIKLIAETRARGGKTLVHCSQGVSRSGAVSIAYLMWAESLTFDAAYTRAREHRNTISPNPGFICQLLEWEQLLRLTRDTPSVALMYRVETLRKPAIASGAIASWLAASNVGSPARAGSPASTTFKYVVNLARTPDARELVRPSRRSFGPTDCGIIRCGSTAFVVVGNACEDSSPKVHRCHVEVQCWELLWGKKFQVVVCELGREPPELLEALVLGAAVDISTPVLPKQQPSAPDSTRPVPASSASKGAGETRAPRSVTATRVGAPGAGAGAGAAAAAAAAGVDTTDAAAGGGGGSPAGAPVVPSVVTGAVPVGDDFNSSAPQRGGRGGGGVDGIRQAGARGRNTVRLSPAHAQQSTSPKLVAAVETSQPQQPQQPPKSEQADALRLNNFASVVPTVGSSLALPTSRGAPPPVTSRRPATTSAPTVVPAASASGSAAPVSPPKSPTTTALAATRFVGEADTSEAPLMKRGGDDGSATTSQVIKPRLLKFVTMDAAEDLGVFDEDDLEESGLCVLLPPGTADDSSATVFVWFSDEFAVPSDAEASDVREFAKAVAQSYASVHLRGKSFTVQVEAGGDESDEFWEVFDS